MEFQQPISQRNPRTKEALGKRGLSCCKRAEGLIEQVQEQIS